MCQVQDTVLLMQEPVLTEDTAGGHICGFHSAKRSWRQAQLLFRKNLDLTEINFLTKAGDPEIQKRKKNVGLFQERIPIILIALGLLYFLR